jgi:hypothetical protein
MRARQGGNVMRRGMIAFFIIVGVVGAAVATSAQASTSYPMNTPNKLIYDMNGPQEDHPHGTCPSDSFYSDPEVDHVSPPSTYTSVTPWGAIYQGASGNSVTNVRVEVRNLQLWAFSRSQGTWTMISSTPQLRFSNPYPDGDMFNEINCNTFTNKNHAVKNWRYESDGGTSVVMESGYWFHFWLDGTRPTINPADIEAVMTTFEAKIVKDNPKGPDNTAKADYIAAAGADWYLNQTAGYPNNSQSFFGRFERIATDWKAFSGWPGGSWGCGANACQSGTNRVPSTTDYDGNPLLTTSWLLGAPPGQPAHTPSLPNFSETTTALPYPTYPN